MGFTYLDKFTYLNTFVIEVAQRWSDNQGPTVLCCSCCAKLEAYKPFKDQDSFCLGQWCS